MKKLFVILSITIALSGCCVAQIGVQYYFVNDSCEFYLPDYSQAVEVRDNCCVEQFVQDPPSGMMLAPGEDIIVTLTGTDCSGNTTSMQFPVIAIDTIPPTFYYDSTQFLPTGMYQNEMRTWHFYTVIDTIPDSQVMNHYYREGER